MKKIFVLVLLLSVAVPGCSKKKTIVNGKTTKVQNVQGIKSGKTLSEDADEFVLEDEAGFNVFEDDSKKQVETDSKNDLSWDELNEDVDKNERVQFGYDKSVIEPNEKAKITRNAKKIKSKLAKDANVKVVVKGHSCKIAKNKEYNYVLSQERAEKVRNEYEQEGVPASNLKSVGYGATNPLTDEDGMEAQAINRRAETVITK